MISSVYLDPHTIYCAYNLLCFMVSFKKSRRGVGGRGSDSAQIEKVLL